MFRPRFVTLTISSLFFAICLQADQNGTCSMDDGRKAHYFCPDGFELMLAGGGKEDCSGRCYRPGSSDVLKAIKDTMQFSYGTPLTDQQAISAANQFTKTGVAKVKTTEGKEIDIRKPKGELR